MGNRIFASRASRAVLFALLTSACSLALGVNPAAAQVAAADLPGIQAAVDKALAGVVVPSGATQAQIDALNAAAIDSVMESLITSYPSDSAQSLAEVVITEAAAKDASGTAVGDGLATAALDEGSTNGTQIADALASTGTTGEISAFQSTALAANTTLGQTLSADAGATGTVGAGPSGGSGGTPPAPTIGGGLGGGGGGGGGCTNPSCT